MSVTFIPAESQSILADERVRFNERVVIIQCSAVEAALDDLTALGHQIRIEEFGKLILKKPEKSDDEHWALLNAIKNHNSAEARRVMFDHINDSRSNLLHNLEENAPVP